MLAETNIQKMKTKLHFEKIHFFISHFFPYQFCATLKKNKKNQFVNQYERRMIYASHSFPQRLFNDNS